MVRIYTKAELKAMTLKELSQVTIWPTLSQLHPNQYGPITYPPLFYEARRAHWEENPDKTQDFIKLYLKRVGVRLKHFFEDKVEQKIDGEEAV